MFDSLAVSMFILVNTVSTLVHIYSVFYMETDPHFIRFMSYLSFFTFFMLVLVSADNFIQLFLGWEGVGLCSYLLINFWFTRVQANKAALKAIIVNRIGDFGLTVAILLIFYCFRTLDFDTVFLLSLNFTHIYIPISFIGFGGLIFIQFEVHFLSLICFCLFVGSVGKSAQVGLHT
jgi:NADH:ubiquinone oxidoreductase subunit 5 (subunit L)/multisubunit Na+/H+ antiporter MnhA subunit